MRNTILLLAALTCFRLSVPLAHAGCVKMDIDDTSPGAYEDSDGDVKCAVLINITGRIHPSLLKPVEPKQNAHLNSPASAHPVLGHTDVLSRHHVDGHAKPTILASSLAGHSR